MKIVLMMDHVKVILLQVQVIITTSYYNNVLLLTMWFRQEKMSNSINDKNFLVEL